MAIETVVAIAAALGVRELLPRIVDAILKHYTGRASRERSRVDHLEADRRAAESERDRQALWRRLLQEYASLLRSMLIERGANPDSLPPVPPEPRSRS